MYFKKIILSVIGVALVLAGGAWWYRVSRAPAGWRLLQPGAIEAVTGLAQVVPVAIIGSGPAGLSAALYSVRLGYYTVVFEGQKPGGQLTETTYVENWPGVGKMLGPELMKKQRAYVTQLGAVLVPDAIVAADVSRWPFVLRTDEGHEVRALSVIIATGSAPRVLNVAGERAYWGKGVTTCALCDAPLYKNKNVVVVGGGDTALEEVLQIAPYARAITVLVRKNNLRASATLQARVRALGKVTILFNHEVTQVVGDGTWVTGVQVRDGHTQQTSILPTHGVFLAIGHEPRTKLFAGQVACVPEGHVLVVGRSQCTNVPGVFAAGEVEDGVYRQAGVAAGDGIKAAIDASRFLNELGWADQRRRELGVRFYAPQQIPHDAVMMIKSFDELQRLIAQAKKPVIVDFYATHCPSCMHMLPSFQTVAQHFVDDALFVKVDTVKVPALESFYKVERIPCFLIFKHGQQVARYYAIMDKAQMIAMVRRVL